jgi:hypothetical protein
VLVQWLTLGDSVREAFCPLRVQESSSSLPLQATGTPQEWGASLRPFTFVAMLCDPVRERLQCECNPTHHVFFGLLFGTHLAPSFFALGTQLQHSQ